MFMTIRYTELLCCLPCDVVFNLSKLLAAIFTSNSGCIVDSKQDDCSTRKGNRQPWVCVLLGLQGKPTNNKCVNVMLKIYVTYHLLKMYVNSRFRWLSPWKTVLIKTLNSEHSSIFPVLSTFFRTTFQYSVQPSLMDL